MPGSFIDTKVLVSLASDDPAKADRAEQIATRCGTISIQVFSECANMARRIMGLSWGETHDFLSTVRTVLAVDRLTGEVHDAGRALRPFDL